MKTKKVTISFPIKLLEALDNTVNDSELFISRSHFVSEAVRSKLEEMFE